MRLFALLVAASLGCGALTAPAPAQEGGAVQQPGPEDLRAEIRRIVREELRAALRETRNQEQRPRAETKVGRELSAMDEVMKSVEVEIRRATEAVEEAAKEAKAGFELRRAKGDEPSKAERVIVLRQEPEGEFRAKVLRAGEHDPDLRIEAVPEVRVRAHLQHGGDNTADLRKVLRFVQGKVEEQHGEAKEPKQDGKCCCCCCCCRGDQVGHGAQPPWTVLRTPVERARKLRSLGEALQLEMKPGQRVFEVRGSKEPIQVRTLRSKKAAQQQEEEEEEEVEHEGGCPGCEAKEPSNRPEPPPPPVRPGAAGKLVGKLWMV